MSRGRGSRLRRRARRFAEGRMPLAQYVACLTLVSREVGKLPDGEPKAALADVLRKLDDAAKGAA